MTKPGLESSMEGGSEVGIEVVCDDGLDISDDDLDEVLNVLGNVDELLEVDYMPIQFGIV